MSSRVLPAVLVLLASTALLACPSKDNSSSSGAASPSGAASTGAGPLANLESSPFVAESWTSQEGEQMQFIHFTGQRVRISASCRQPNGQLACDAVRQLRSGMPIEVSGRELNMGISAGTKACRKINQTLVSAHDASGNEDGFCRFGDGSLISTGALEQYNLHVTD